MDLLLDDLSGPAIRALLEAHLRHMHTLSPLESVHAMDVERLRAPD
jgi:putative acetyltransferase